MKALTATVEKNTRAWFKSELEPVIPGLTVVSTPYYFTSKQDFIKQSGGTWVNDEQSRVNYLMINYSNFVDVYNEICEDNPNVLVTYRMQLFKEFEEVRSDGSHSTDDLVAQFIAIKNYLLDHTDILTISDTVVSHRNIFQFENAVLFKPCEHVVKCIGDWLNLGIQVEVKSKEAA